jgi:hypothetical protein
MSLLSFSYFPFAFSGQLEYLPCHRHFLSSKRTIFVVMVNSSKSLPKQRKDITYWLNFIKKGVASRDKKGTYREERLLLVVGTKIDLLDTEVIQVPDLLKQYRELVHLFEEPGKEKVFNIGALQSLAISVILPTTIQALQDELYGMVRSLSNLEKTEGDRFILRKAASLLGELQEDRELVVRRQVDLETTTKDGVKVDHIEALECLHNAGELAFLDSVGWVCLEPTLLEQCSGLFVGPLGHQAELKSEFENNKHTSVMKKAVAIGGTLSSSSSFSSLSSSWCLPPPSFSCRHLPVVIRKFLKSKATKPVTEIVATSVLEVFLAIKLCFESEDDVIFPSEFGKGETFTLPPCQNAGNKCQRAILIKVSS